MSVLPFLSKVFEILFITNFMTTVTKASFFFQTVCVRSLHSVVTCLLNLTNDRYVNMDKVQDTWLVFMDLKGAFGIVDHEILLKKMTKYGIIGLENTLFASYLENRIQFSRVNGVPSNLGSINS